MTKRTHTTRGRLVPDRHPDEHATCYVVRGRGLVVISSCSHCGLINAIRQAMAVSLCEEPVTFRGSP
jgi:7,8-dihydropterin-6-yl-methyl-4-(beta-D-ribofuranosyl)aminobenzene 5'-phosphate synthase